MCSLQKNHKKLQSNFRTQHGHNILFNTHWVNSDSVAGIIWSILILLIQVTCLANQFWTQGPNALSLKARLFA